ncbi:HPr(Ser) kinase/phosphatase [candidate division KSB1 bacterium]|nr:HPr(Ser) kinase/phosphatase [candidate division KSB1 bacterium]
MKVQYIAVKDLYDANAKRVRLSILNNESSFERKIFEKELHRPGLALSGFVEVFTYWRVQIMGNTEIGYLNTLHGKERIRAIASVLGFDLPCIIITNNNIPPDELLEIADENGITVFSTPLTTTTVTHHLSEFLDGIFADTTIVHGSMLEVFGVGVLITGESAIGKSELALDLIERGHQLVADDVVHVTKVGASQLEGAPSDLLAHHMEIRGLGIIDIRKLFGIRAVRGKKGVEVIVHLEKWDDEKEYERIGMEETVREILDVPIPLITLPIVPGKNITIIAEAVALNQKLKEQGTYTARDFNERLIAKMNKSESD